MMTKLRSTQVGGDQRGLSAMTKRLKPADGTGLLLKLEFVNLVKCSFNIY